MAGMIVRGSPAHKDKFRTNSAKESDNVRQRDAACALASRGVAGEPDPQQLLTALTTEHFTLQGARSQTISESAARASLYLFSVSSTLVALGFIGQRSATGDIFNVFALTVLPTLYLLGLFTFVRLVQSVNEDFQYARAINRIRHYYLELAGDKAHLFVMSAHDDAVGVLANMGIKRSTWQAYFTTPTMIAVINSVVGGSAVAIALGAIAEPPLGVAAGIGGLVAIVSLAALRRFETRYLREGIGQLEVLFPSR
jgi:hypothetical protein